MGLFFSFFLLTCILTGIRSVAKKVRRALMYIFIFRKIQFICNFVKNYSDLLNALHKLHTLQFYVIFNFKLLYSNVFLY
jgi:hypothetical protein